MKMKSCMPVPIDAQREAFSSLRNVLLLETLKAIQAPYTYQHDRHARGSSVASSRPRSNDAKPYDPNLPPPAISSVCARTGMGKTLLTTAATCLHHRKRRRRRHARMIPQRTRRHSQCRADFVIRNELEWLEESEV